MTGESLGRSENSPGLETKESIASGLRDACMEFLEKGTGDDIFESARQAPYNQGCEIWTVALLLGAERIIINRTFPAQNRTEIVLLGTEDLALETSERNNNGDFIKTQISNQRLKDMRTVMNKLNSADDT